VDALKHLGHVENAGLLFMNPTNGLRTINEAEQLACFEYSATLTSSAIKRLIFGIRPSMTEYEAASLLRESGHPRSVHPILCSGPRAAYGLASPSHRKIEHGDPIAAAFGLWGALNCRAGFIVKDESELPAGISDYLGKLVKPYFSAAVAWYEAIGIGVEGGTIFDAVMSHVGDSFFGVGLNPGHLIHLDEWVHSPIKKGSKMKMASGMAVQCDIIPATGTPYFTSNIEDGIALADAPLRAEFKTKFPEAWVRIEARRAFMTEKLGIRLKPEVLPFSNIPAWLPPFWLSPENVMTML
jgi:hypothetical protein